MSQSQQKKVSQWKSFIDNLKAGIRSTCELEYVKRWPQGVKNEGQRQSLQMVQTNKQKQIEN